jgi:hypothetical protein
LYAQKEKEGKKERGFRISSVETCRQFVSSARNRWSLWCRNVAVTFSGETIDLSDGNEDPRKRMKANFGEPFRQTLQARDGPAPLLTFLAK